MHPLKMFEISGHPQFKQLHGHKIFMNATNTADRLDLYIFSSNVHAWWLCHLSITHDVIRGHVNHVITIMTLISFTELRYLYSPEQCIFIAYVIKDAANATDWGTEITMGILFAFLRVAPSVQMRVVARRNHGVSREAKNSIKGHAQNMWLSFLPCHFRSDEKVTARI